MANRSCELCGVDITHKRSNAKFCSRKHKSKASDLKRNFVEEYQRNKEVRRKQALKYYYANHTQAKLLMLERQKKRLDKVAAYEALRRAKKLQRTPTWLTTFDKLKIECMYKIAAMLTRENEELWHVDHVIPLQGKLVSGLHVPNNLQVMRAIDNIAKNNKYEVI